MADSNCVITSERNELLETPEDLAEFVKSLADETLHVGSEMRASVRYKVTSEVVVQPVNAKCEPTGHAFSAISRDISTRGMCLFSPVAVDTRFLLVEIPNPSGTTNRLLLEVLRNDRLRGFFEIGGRFVMRMGYAGQ